MVTISVIEGMLDAEYDQEKWDFLVSLFLNGLCRLYRPLQNNGMKEDPGEYISRIRGLFDGSVLSELESRSQENNESIQN